MMLDNEVMLKTLMGWKEIKLSDRESATAFLLKMIQDNRIICEAEGFALYLKCSDEMLEKIRSSPSFMLNPDTVTQVMADKGDNIHFFGLVSLKEGQGRPGIYKGLRELMERERPKSISWYNKVMDKFIIRRLPCHQQ